MIGKTYVFGPIHLDSSIDFKITTDNQHVLNRLFYETKGDCFGIEVPATMNANDCPQKAFQAIESNDRH